MDHQREQIGQRVPIEWIRIRWPIRRDPLNWLSSELQVSRSSAYRANEMNGCFLFLISSYSKKKQKTIETIEGIEK